MKPSKADIESPKKRRNHPKKDEKHLAYSVLVANGVSREKAASMLGYSEKSARSLDRLVKEKGLKLPFLSERRVKKAHQVVDRCLAGKTFGSVEKVKDSTALRAAELVLERSSPVNQVSPGPTVQFTRIDLNLCRHDRETPLTKTVDLTECRLPERAGENLVAIAPKKTPRGDKET